MSTPHTDSSTSPRRLIVAGATGRTGRRICELALTDTRFTLLGALTHAASTALGTPITHASTLRFVSSIESSATAHAVIAFCLPSGIVAATSLATRHSAALVVGTTGLDAAATATLRAAAGTIPVLLAPNTSLGVAVLADLAARAAAGLGSAFQASIVEAHHAHKKDAPSGTAARLAAAITARGGSIAPSAILSLRSGDVIGEHTIRFAGDGEYLELTHRATTRDLFARGALHAAAWLAGKPAGWYTIEQTFG